MVKTVEGRAYKLDEDRYVELFKTDGNYYFVRTSRGQKHQELIITKEALGALIFLIQELPRGLLEDIRDKFNEHCLPWEPRKYEIPIVEIAITTEFREDASEISGVEDEVKEDENG